MEITSNCPRLLLLKICMAQAMQINTRGQEAAARGKEQGCRRLTTAAASSRIKLAHRFVVSQSSEEVATHVKQYTEHSSNIQHRQD